MQAGRTLDKMINPEGFSIYTAENILLLGSIALVSLLPIALKRKVE
jgi:hypothetical protein